MSGRSPRWFTGIKPNGATITIKLGTPYSATYAYVTIDGVKYTDAATVVVPYGTEVLATVAKASSGMASISLDGTNVKTDQGTYTYVADKSATITMSREGTSSRNYRGVIAIVTE